MKAAHLTTAKTVSKFAGLTLAALLVVGCSSKGTTKETTDTGETISSGTTSTQISGINSSNIGDLQNVFYFEFDQAAIRSEGINDLSLHAQFLAENPNAAVRLEGHTDEQGTREYNIALGERRAQAIEQFLAGRSASNGQMETISYGEEKPSVSGLASQNRRVVIKYTAK